MFIQQTQLPYWLPVAAKVIAWLVATASSAFGALSAYRQLHRSRRDNQRADEKERYDSGVEFALSILDRTDVKEKIVDILISSQRAETKIKDASRTVVAEVLADSPVHDLIMDVRTSVRRLEDYIFGQLAQPVPRSSSGDPMLQIRKE